MGAYRDVFGRKLTKEDVVQSVIHTVRGNNPFPSHLQRSMKIGFGKAARLAKVLADAGVTTPVDTQPRRILLKEDAAINAALRQLKKGHR